MINECKHLNTLDPMPTSQTSQSTPAERRSWGELSRATHDTRHSLPEARMRAEMIEAEWFGRFHCAGCPYSRGLDVCLDCWEDEERVLTSNKVSQAQEDELKSCRTDT